VRRALVLVVLAALAAPAASLAVTQRQNSIHANTFNPRTIRVIVGDTVRWTNHDFVSHDVQSDDGGATFGSGILANNQSYTSPVFSAPGTVPYHCNQHSFMHGTVSVYDIWLGTPAITTFGSNAKFTGLAQANAGVHIETTTGVQVGTDVTATTQGVYTVLTTAPPPGFYRADDGTHESTPVKLSVRPKLTIAKGKIRRGLWRVVVKATSVPNQTGATAIIDRKKSFGWAKLASKSFGLSSKATFTVQIPAGKSQLRVRVRLTNPKNGYSPATSASFVLKR
jgi:plastocyanin